jgi:hypothetical protein
MPHFLFSYVTFWVTDYIGALELYTPLTNGEEFLWDYQENWQSATPLPGQHTQKQDQLVRVASSPGFTVRGFSLEKAQQFKKH